MRPKINSPAYVQNAVCGKKLTVHNAYHTEDTMTLGIHGDDCIMVLNDFII